MLAFEVYVNRKRVCVAGIGEVGALNTMVDHVVGNGFCFDNLQPNFIPRFEALSCPQNVLPC